MKNFVMNVGFGSFDGIAKDAQIIANKAENLDIKRNVEFDFNGIICVVSPETDLTLLYRDYVNAHLMDWTTVGPDCVEQYSQEISLTIDQKKKQQEEESQKRQEEYQKQQEEKKISAEQKLKGIEMEFSDKDSWDKGFELNSDSYGRACYTYAERWARLMQYEAKQVLKEPNLLLMTEFADSTSHEADIEGISGFMYGAAVSILAKSWKYGEALRKWHNKEYGHEGDGVVNPAILTISKK